MSSPRTEPLAEAPRDSSNDTVDPKELKELRRNWKWAAVCDFLWTFNTAMRLDLLNYFELEKDIINGSTTIMATVIIKMLFTLTAIRGLGAETWQIYLRRHLAKRDEKNPLLGTDDDPREIKDLTIDQRLGLMHNLCEWQFQDPTRLRQNMGHNDDSASWRTLSIGRDAKRNTYWQYGRDRLWIQRPTTKMSETPVKKGKKGGKAKATAKSKKEDSARQMLSSQSGQASRAARAKARAMGTRLSSRLRRGDGDPEWQELPEEWLQDDSKKPKPDAKGHESDRGSGSFFNADSDLTDISDNEQVVPPDRKPVRKVVTSDNEEDTPFGSGSLTDIDEEKEKEKEAKDEAGETKEILSDEREKTPDPKDPNFIELETICTTLDDWKKFAAKFEKSQHKDEKRLHKHIVKWIIPDLERRQEELDEIERKHQEDIRKREEAAAKVAAAILEKEDPKFKRQTRRAARAGELGSDERAFRRQRDYVELDERRRRGEPDARLDDSARTRRVSARNARRLLDERFDGEGSETFPGTEGDEISAQVSDRGRDEDEYKDEDEIKRSNQVPDGRTRRAAAIAAEALTQPKAGRRRRRQDSDVEMDDDEPWFLSCEVCHKTGWNENDGQKLLACSSCDIWQHVACHDLADRRDGRPKRDWRVDKFTCKSCLEKAANKRTRKRRKKDIAVSAEGEGQDGVDALGEQPTEPRPVEFVPVPIPPPAPAPPMHFQSPPKQPFTPQPNGRPVPPQMHPHPQQPYEFAQLNNQVPIPSPSVPLGEAPQMGYPPYPQTSIPNGHGFPMAHHFNIPSGPPPYPQQHIGPHAPMMMPPHTPWNPQPNVMPNGVPMMSGMNMNGMGPSVHRQQQYFMGNPGP